MVSKCANPGCVATFHYMHQGKLFVVEEHRADDAVGFGSAPQRSRYFWLCSRCSETLTLAYDEQSGLRVVPARTGPPGCSHTATN